MPKLVAVYGTLKAGFSNHRLMGRSTFMGEDVLDGFVMYSLGHFPACIQGEGEIHVEVYSVPDEDMASLDMLEGYREEHPESSFYLRGKVDTEHGEAFMYTLNNREYLHGKPPIANGVWKASRAYA